MKHFFCFQWKEATPSDFVRCWAALYPITSMESLYTNNINRKFTHDEVMALFRWKNGGNLSSAKENSVTHNYIDRIHELSELPTDCSAQEFLDRFAKGGAIWRIFWLHCWQPKKFPIYDQHVHRAMRCITNGKPEEPSTNDRDKIYTYQTEYIPFWEQFISTLDERQKDRDADRALWSFGKFLKTWPKLIPSADNAITAQ